MSWSAVATGHGRRWSMLVMLCAGTVCGEPGPPFPTTAPIDFPALLAVLDGDASEKQWTTMEAFAAQPDAPQAIPQLFEHMRRKAPSLDNNVGLMIEMILRRHPQAPCAMEPLLEAIRRPIWNSQQKCAQALCVLLERGDGKDREKELAAILIPLLASQRPRVFDAAECCLEALTGEEFGDVPDPWLEWFEAKYGTDLDMSGAVYEDLVVIDAEMVGEGEARAPLYRVEGVEIRDVGALEAVLARRATAAKRLKRQLEVSIRISDERMKAAGLEPDNLMNSPDIREAMKAVQAQVIRNVVVSPRSDAFRAPWSGRH